ncbi:MAG TPA: hypothetical protein VGG79_12650 [Roseiarcus sp.]|jgi:hypothetical protein
MSNAERVKNFKLLKMVGGTHVWQIKGSSPRSAFFFETGIGVDVDGAPNAYAPNNAIALDNHENAGHPGNWWGVQTDNHGRPIIQHRGPPSQPLTGFYISTTSLIDAAFAEDDVRRYVDATKIPYLALPPAYFTETGLRIGDLSLVINTQNGKFCFAIFADTKYHPVLSEVSARVVDRLGTFGNPKGGPSPSAGIIRIVFPGSGLGNKVGWPDEHTIDVAGSGFLDILSRRLDKQKTLANAYSEFRQFATALTAAGYGQ